MLNKRVSFFLFSIGLFISGCATVPRQTTIMPQGIYHIAGSGQTLRRIAKTYNVDIQEIMRVNKINDPAQIGIGQELFIPRARALLPVEPYKPVIPEAVEKLVGQRYRFSKWRYITIHHSATLEGKATECPGDNFPFYRLLAELRKVKP